MDTRLLHAASFLLLCATANCTAPSEPPPPPPVKHTLSVTLGGSGAGSISSSPGGISCGADCSEPYNEGTSVTLNATAGTGSNFTGWDGACTGTGSCMVNLVSPVSVTANFALIQHDLTVVLAGNGAGTVVSDPAGIDCGADCAQSFAFGTSVTLTASPSTGSTFTGWSGGSCTGTGTCTVNMTAAATVTATFTLQQFPLNVTRAGTGTGSVTSSPAGIDCGNDCVESYDHGTVVTLTAAAVTGSTFAGWSGGNCSGTGTCVVTITDAATVSATFTLTTHTLTVVRTGTGTGTVTSSPAGINCGADCTELRNFGSSITLTAAAATGSTFAGWSGGGCTGTGACTVTVTAATTVTATFTLATHTLTAVRVGSGTITSSPAGINCGLDCSQSYNHGTAVTLTATPASGFTFGGWSGGGCTGTGACVVTVTGATSVTATFNDNVGPVLSSSLPAHQAIGAATNNAIALTFSEPMDQAATQAAFSVTLPAGVTGTFSWSGNTMTFQPTNQFQCTADGVTVRWTLSTAAQDVAGNNVAAAVTREFRVIRCIAEFFYPETGLDGQVTSANAVSTNGTTFRVGDFANGTFARGFVSFDFSSIPSNAQILGAWTQMDFTRIGDESQLGELVLEPVVYGASLDAGDFSLAPVFASPSTNAIESTVFWFLDAQFIDAWNNRATRGSRMQVRIRTQINAFLNGIADGYDFLSAEGGGATHGPRMQVQYRIP